MAESPVIYALRAKRAEIDGELRQTEKHAAKLRNDLAAIDGVLILFDPSLEPHKIRSKRKKRAPMHFRYGQFTRNVLDLLRRSERPLTVRDIVDRLVKDYSIDVSANDAVYKLSGKVRNALTSQRAIVACEKDGGAVFWRISDKNPCAPGI